MGPPLAREAGRAGRRGACIHVATEPGAVGSGYNPLAALPTASAHRQGGIPLNGYPGDPAECRPASLIPALSAPYEAATRVLGELALLCPSDRKSWRCRRAATGTRGTSPLDEHRFNGLCGRGVRDPPTLRAPCPSQPTTLPTPRRRDASEVATRDTPADATTITTWGCACLPRPTPSPPEMGACLLHPPPPPSVTATAFLPPHAPPPPNFVACVCIQGCFHAQDRWRAGRKQDSSGSGGVSSGAAAASSSQWGESQGLPAAAAG